MNFYLVFVYDGKENRQTNYGRKKKVLKLTRSLRQVNQSSLRINGQPTELFRFSYNEVMS